MTRTEWLIWRAVLAISVVVFLAAVVWAFA